MSLDHRFCRTIILSCLFQIKMLSALFKSSTFDVTLQTEEYNEREESEAKLQSFMEADVLFGFETESTGSPVIVETRETRSEKTPPGFSGDNKQSLANQPHDWDDILCDESPARGSLLTNSKFAAFQATSWLGDFSVPSPTASPRTTCRPLRTFLPDDNKSSCFLLFPVHSEPIRVPRRTSQDLPCSDQDVDEFTPPHELVAASSWTAQDPCSWKSSRARLLKVRSGLLRTTGFY